MKDNTGTNLRVTTLNVSKSDIKSYRMIKYKIDLGMSNNEIFLLCNKELRGDNKVNRYLIQSIRAGRTRICSCGKEFYPNAERQMSIHKTCSAATAFYHPENFRSLYLPWGLATTFETDDPHRLFRIGDAR